MTADTSFPHEDVYVRLGVSPIHGIGVFAIRVIPAGTNIFANDLVELKWIERAALEAVSMLPAERDFYEAFGISRGAMIGCPVNFHNLTPGWYCNEPAAGTEPNVLVDGELNFFARDDLAEGEELTVRYASFSDPVPEGGSERQ